MFSLIGNKHTVASISPAFPLDINVYSFYPQRHDFKLFLKLFSLVSLTMENRFNLSSCNEQPFQQGLWSVVRAMYIYGEEAWSKVMQIKLNGKQPW